MIELAQVAPSSQLPETLLALSAFIGSIGGIALGVVAQLRNGRKIDAVHVLAKRTEESVNGIEPGEPTIRENVEALAAGVAPAPVAAPVAVPASNGRRGGLAQLMQKMQDQQAEVTEGQAAVRALLDDIRAQVEKNGRQT